MQYHTCSDYYNYNKLCYYTKLIYNLPGSVVGASVVGAPVVGTSVVGGAAVVVIVVISSRSTVVISSPETQLNNNIVDTNLIMLHAVIY